MKINHYKKIKNSMYEVTIGTDKYKIYDELILKYNLLLSNEIEVKTLAKLLAENDEYQAYHLALKYIGIKLRTKKEIKTYLDKKEFSAEIIQKTIAKLDSNNLLDSKLYLTSYINDQINLTLNGPYKILNNLIKLGFTETEILNYMDFSDPVWFSKIEKIIAKKTKTNHKLSNNELKRKLKNDLYNLGYQENLEEFLDKINVDDQETFPKQADKYYEKLQKKHSNQNKLNYAFKNKMFSLGYDLELIQEYLNKKNN